MNLHQEVRGRDEQGDVVKCSCAEHTQNSGDVVVPAWQMENKRGFHATGKFKRDRPRTGRNSYMPIREPGGEKNKLTSPSANRPAK